MSARISRLYGPAYDFPIFEGKPSKQLVIATSARSGSTYLATLLWQTGCLGAPLEYMNLDRLAATLPDCTDAGLLAYLGEVRRRRTSPNGVFSMKMFAQFALAAMDAKPELFRSVFEDCVLVLLKREDTVAQAVSFVRANQTKRWFADAIEHQIPRYDFAEIDYAYRRVQAQERWWEWLVSSLNPAHIRLTYEEIVRSPGKCVLAIADAAGVKLEPERTRPIPPVEVQRDELNQSWCDRFRRDREKEKTEQGVSHRADC